MQISSSSLKPPHLNKKENLKKMGNNNRLPTFNKQNNKENIELFQNNEKINNTNTARNTDRTRIIENMRNVDENSKRSASSLKSSNEKKSMILLSTPNSISISNVQYNRSKSNLRPYNMPLQENEQTREPFKARKAPNMQIAFQIYKSKMPLTIPSGFKITDHKNYIK